MGLALIVNIKLVALHKHWITADSIKQFMLAEMPANGAEGLSPELLKMAQMHSMGTRLSVFYALIFVVVEGYQELKLTDKTIDDLLLKTEFVDALRRFRNAVFHYQGDPLSSKLMDFLNAQDSDKWVKSLYESFGRYFERELRIKETLDRHRKTGELPDIV
jgi:hypothetical protein